MTITELIVKLQEIKEDYGGFDFDVFCGNKSEILSIEMDMSGMILFVKIISEEDK